MNRSILIVICDFLLVSLLLFSTPDIQLAGEKATPETLHPTVNTNRVQERSDLAEVMKQALEEERKVQDDLLAKLATTRETAQEQEVLLTQRQTQLQLTQQKLQTTEQEASQLQQQLSTREQEALRLKQQQQQVQTQYDAAQTSIRNLKNELQERSNESLISQEKLAAAEAELERQAQAAAGLKQQLSQLTQSNLAVLNQKQELTTQLRVAELEKQHATEQVVAMRTQVETERAEKAKLAEGVRALASTSGELAQEIRQNRPLASNTIFNEFLTNRTHLELTGERAGLFGDSDRSKEANTILVRSGTNLFALCHVEDTLFKFTDPGPDWQGLTGTLSRGEVHVPIDSVSFSFRDPRVVFIPVRPQDASKLGNGIYPIDSDPFRFADAVLVGANEGYYGECRFEIDPETPGYLKLNRSFLKGVFGQFNPSRGDLVFSRTGGLLGIMVNNTYCFRIQDFETAATLQLGQKASEQRTGRTLSALYGSVSRLASQLR